jgi:hypothetical protein
MRDCPACRVPLHGYEDVCPSCGTKQAPTRGGGGRQIYGTGFKPQEPSVNWIPFVLAFLAIGVFIVVAMQGSWIGAVMRGENKQAEDPLAKMSYTDARNAMDAELNKNLTAVGATNTKMTWKATGAAAATAPAEGGAGEQAVDARAIDGPVELDIETKLPNKELRKQVIDPVKPYMEPAKVMVLQMQDTASHATWTYNLQQASAPQDDEQQ